MTPQVFIEAWKNSTANERQGAQTHFNSLCDLLKVPKPSGTSLMDGYGFEINVDKTGGGQGFADAWKRGCFAWEYKSPGRDLSEALRQLKLYASDLQNPPLLIVSDMRRIEVHTNWTNMVQEKHIYELEDLADANVRQKLASAFSEDTVAEYRPSRSANATTEEVAQRFVQIAQNLRERGHDPEQVAHFVNRMVFCMFAEDVGLLPKRLFEQMLVRSLEEPEHFTTHAETLFSAMSKRDGVVGYERIEWFNGGLFEDGTALPLTEPDIRIALDAARQNWSEINPSIMGTLFERGLDPSKRSQIGAFYTDAEKIMMIVRPVIIEPLLREWAKIREQIDHKLEAAKGKAKSSHTKAMNEAQALRVEFVEKLKNFRVLDPACGSGNFLYVALKELKNIEFRVNFEAEGLGLPPGFPSVGPECVKGIEINPFAAELARVSVWIGEIQWMREKGFGVSKNPILKSLETIECRDALLNPDGTEAEWPEADVIIGNPPFLGDKKMIRELGEATATRLRETYRGAVPGGANLVCFWLSQARRALDRAITSRVGFVTTNAIRTGADRRVLELLATAAPIFEAWSDEPWVVEGASVRVSIVCHSKLDFQKHLDGKLVESITPSLSPFTRALPSALNQNAGYSFTGTFLNGPFEIPEELAREWLTAPRNVAGHKNSDVIKLTANGQDLLQRGPRKWLLDYGVDLSEQDAALYEAPFKYAAQNIKPFRQRKDGDGNFEVRRVNHRERWWLHAEPRPGMRRALSGLERFIVTPMVSSTRVFCFLSSAFLANQKLVVFPKDDFLWLGLLSSSHHELWTLEYCSWIGAGNDPTYAANAVFLTFPFPEGLTPNIPAADYANDPRAIAIAKAAARLNELRENWLNPPDLVQRVPEVVPSYPDRILPVDDKAAAILKKRTLTNLYNERPAWLDMAHKELDRAVAAAYGWPDDLSDDEILARLFTLNQQRAQRETT